jgi:hypothetical protein
MATKTTPPGGGENNPPSDHVPTGAINPGLARSEELLLPEESAAEFRRLRLGMHEDLRPRGVYETTLVERFIANQWRMQRCPIMEAEVIAHRREYATAWANPRRVKTPPSAGAVWADDLQFYGAALEKLSKKEYRLSLENSRILRQLAQRQKAREEGDAGGEDFMARLEALRENRATAGEPQISQMDADEQRTTKQAAQPRNSRMDTDELPDENNDDVNLRKSASSAVPIPLSHATEPKPISGNLQNELPPAIGGANSHSSEAEPSHGEPRLAQIDTGEAQAGGSRQFNPRSSAKSAVPKQYRHSAVGSGA